MNLPRVLLLSDEGPQTGSAGGLLLHRLFADYPSDRLLVLARYVPTIGDPLPNVCYRQFSTPWARFEKSRFNRLKRSLRAWGLTPSLNIRTLNSLIGDFNPEVVLCVMQHAACYDGAADFAQTHQLPLVVIIHDLNDSFEPVLPWAKEAALKRDASFYRQAKCRLCVSPEMEHYFHQRYGMAGDVLYPNRSENLQPRPFIESAKLRRAGQLTIGFVGNINYGYGLGLCSMLPALRQSGANLVIYSQHPGSEVAELLSATDCCDFRGFVPSAEAWAGIQRDCDAVWLPYPNPAGKMEDLYRTHFPSKLPEYLVLGMPVIVSGPDYATGLRWVQNHQAGVCASGTDPIELCDIFKRLVQDDAWRLSLAKQSWEEGQRYFDPVVIKNKFYQHLCAVTQSLN
jgi:glycosyltransferase involved in cell wall biosynthesis